MDKDISHQTKLLKAPFNLALAFQGWSIHKSYEETGTVKYDKKEAEGNLIPLYNYVKEGCREVGVSLFFQVTEYDIMVSSCTRRSLDSILGRISS